MTKDQKKDKQQPVKPPVTNPDRPQQTPPTQQPQPQQPQPYQPGRRTKPESVDEVFEKDHTLKDQEYWN
jgi:hypothetical protein